MVFHYMMHVLTLQHQGCVATLGGMPTPFLFRSGYWSSTFGIHNIICRMISTAKHASFLVAL